MAECTITYGKSAEDDKEILEHLAEFDRDVAERGIEAVIAEYADDTKAMAAGVGVPESGRLGIQESQEVPDGVYYVNFTPEVMEKYREELKTLQDEVMAFRSWATGLVGIMVDRQIKNGNLDGGNASKVSSYRAKALDVIFDQRNTVLNKLEAADNSNTLEVRESSFHANILKTALNGFTLGEKAIQVLDSIIDSIVDSLRRSERYSNIRRRYFIFATTYIFDSMTQSIKVQVRTINFESTNETFEVAAHKQKTTYVRVHVGFSGYNYDYNQKEWLIAKETQEVRKLIEEGRKRMGDDPTKDVPVDP